MYVLLFVFLNYEFIFYYCFLRLKDILLFMVLQRLIIHSLYICCAERMAMPNAEIGNGAMEPTTFMPWERSSQPMLSSRPKLWLTQRVCLACFGKHTVLEDFHLTAFAI